MRLCDIGLRSYKSRTADAASTHRRLVATLITVCLILNVRTSRGGHYFLARMLLYGITNNLGMITGHPRAALRL